MIKKLFCILLCIFIILFSVPVNATTETNTIYFDNTIAKFDKVVLYAWKDSAVCFELSPVPGYDNIYYCEIPAIYKNGLFKNIKSINDWDLKTKDIELYNNLIFISDRIDNSIVEGHTDTFYPNYTPPTEEVTTITPTESIISTEPITDAPPDNNTSYEYIKEGGLVSIFLTSLGIDYNNINNIYVYITFIVIGFIFILFFVYCFLKTLLSIARSGKY